MLPRIPTLAAWNKKNTWSDLIQLSVILFGYYSGGKFTCGYVLSVRSVLLRTYGGPHKKNSYIYIYNATSKSVKNAFRNSDWFFVKSKARSFSSNNSSLCCVAERSKSNGRRRRTSTLHVWSIQTEPVKFSTSPSSNLAPPSTNSQFFFFFFFRAVMWLRLLRQSYLRHRRRKVQRVGLLLCETNADPRASAPVVGPRCLLAPLLCWRGEFVLSRLWGPGKGIYVEARFARPTDPTPGQHEPYVRMLRINVCFKTNTIPTFLTDGTRRGMFSNHLFTRTDGIGAIFNFSQTTEIDVRTPRQLSVYRLSGPPTKFMVGCFSSRYNYILLYNELKQ